MNPPNVGTPNDTKEQRPEHIEGKLEATRSAIKDDLRALGDKISPEHLRREAVQSVKDSASTAGRTVVQRVEHLGGEVQRVSAESRDRLQASVQRIKRNPLAMVGGALVLGLGIGLMLPTTESEVRLVEKPVRKARVQAREILDEGRETTRRLRDELQDATADAKAIVTDTTHDEPAKPAPG